jgi:glycosyltransferase involved in cell wall biosynthesis
MSSLPRVSAIIVFLNAEKFLSEAIESVLAQHYDNWELLLVDDGSSDASTAIARRYSELQPERVRYLHHESHMNRGISASRNLGLQHAKGDYIAFLDSDDVWLPNKLQMQLAIMAEQPEAVMVYGAPELWYGWTGKREDLCRDKKQAITVEPNTLVKPPELFMMFLARTAITPCPSDVLFRREIVNALGGFVESFTGLYDDQVFFAKVTLQAAVFVSGECWSKHRQHPDSICSVTRRTGEYYSAKVNLGFLEWIRTYLHSQGIKDRKIEKILYRRMWRYHHPHLFRGLRTVRYIAESVWSSLAHR